jgi:hypothetical protein
MPSTILQKQSRFADQYAGQRDKKTSEDGRVTEGSANLTCVAGFKFQVKILGLTFVPFLKAP